MKRKYLSKELRQIGRDKEVYVKITGSTLDLLRNRYKHRDEIKLCIKLIDSRFFEETIVI